jgi:predicted lipoprotein with Yx(FWY)xxD motif
MDQTEENRDRDRSLTLSRIAAATVTAGALAVFGFVGQSGATVQTRGAKGVVISTTKNSKLGTILVSGKTLYTLAPSKVACSTTCVKVWPELVLPKGVAKATAGSGVNASKLGTVARSGGVVQVTYGGKPLYFFSGDSASSPVRGDVTDTWGTWTAVVISKLSSSSSGSGSGSVTQSNSGSGGIAF